MAEHEIWSEARAAAIIAVHRDRDGAALEVFIALQAAFGCVTPRAVAMVAEALNLSRAEMHGLVSRRGEDGVGRGDSHDGDAHQQPHREPRPPRPDHLLDSN